jgi:AsmA-like protein
MPASSAVRLIARVLFVGVLILSVPAMALAVLYAKPFEPLRRANIEHFLSDAIDTEVEVRGPIAIGFGWAPTVTIEDIVAVESDLPTDLKGLSAKSLRLEVPLLPLLAGSPQLNTLVVDGLRVSVEIPEGGAADDEGGLNVAALVGDFLRSPFAGDLLLRSATLDYVNRDSGFDLHYSFDEIESRPSDDGGVAIDGTGRLNGEPWQLDGDVDPPGGDEDKRKFVLALVHAGMKMALAGVYDFDSGLLDFEGDTVDMTLTASAPKLKRVLALYGVSGDLEGAGDLSARLSGSLDESKLTDLVLKLAFENGDRYELSGGVGDIATGAGLALTLDGTFAREPLAEGATRPIYDIGITGFNGRIEGALDGMLVRDFHVYTNSIRANLSDIGPITAERLYKDENGRLGLYDVLVLAGDPKRPSVRVAGTVKDIIGFKGVDLKGEIDFLTADVLDLAAEEHAEALGHLAGDVAISDADGSLGIEHLTAQVADSSLIKLGIDLVFDDIREADALTFATHLDIPKFKPFAAALGSEVEEVGQVKFDGTITGSDERIVMAGTTLVGQTTMKGSLVGSLSDDRKPVLSGDIATELLYLADLTKLASINVVYQENVDEADADVFDYSKVWETLFVDMQVKVAKISGGGTDASNIQGRITYLSGVIGLEPLTLTYLGGKASANGKIDTSGKQNSFALKGSVNSLRIGAVLKEMQVSYPLSGALNLTYDLSGAGNTKAQIPRSLNGSFSASLHNGWIGTSLLDLAGMSLPAWLLTRGERGGQATLVCAVAPFSFKNGRGSTRGLVLETRNVQVVGAGSIDFRADTIDLHFKPQALQNQFIKIAQPFAIQGKLGNPSVRLTGAPVAGAVVGTLAAPLNLLATIVQPKAGTPGRVPCRVTQTATQSAPAATTKQRSGPLGLGILGGQRRR